MTYSLTSGDLKDLGWEPDGALHAELLIFGAVDEVIRDCPNVVHTSSTDYTTFEKQYKDEHFSRFRTLLLVRVMRILWSLAAGTAPAASYSLSPLAT
jgi:hypothetical protein